MAITINKEDYLYMLTRRINAMNYLAEKEKQVYIGRLECDPLAVYEEAANVNSKRLWQKVKGGNISWVGQ